MRGPETLAPERSRSMAEIRDFPAAQGAGLVRRTDINLAETRPRSPVVKNCAQISQEQTTGAAVEEDFAR